jgi:Bacteriophage minor capsid protein
MLRTKEYLETNLSLIAPIATPLLSSDSKSIAIRPTPSTPNEPYLDRDKTFNFAFQILVKDPNNMTAYQQCHDIYNALDELPRGSIQSQNGSFFMLRCSCSTIPNWVEQNEHGEHIYTALFNTELTKGG